MKEGRIFNFYGQSKYIEHVDTIIEVSNKQSESEVSQQGKQGEVVKFVQAIDELMDATDENREPVFKFQCHWIAVFRVAADRGIVGSNDYDGFCSMIKQAHPEDFKFKLTKNDVKKISNSVCYFKPFDEWEFVPLGTETRKPYEQMKKVVITLNDILNHQENIENVSR